MIIEEQKWVNDHKNHYIDKIAHYPSKTTKKMKKREATLILSLPYCGFSILWCNLTMGKKRDHIRDEGHNAHNRCNHVDKTAKEPKHCEELKVSFDDVKCLLLGGCCHVGLFYRHTWLDLWVHNFWKTQNMAYACICAQIPNGPSSLGF